MKRLLLLVALMVLVTLVGMVGVSRAGNAVSALQGTTNAPNGAVGTLQATVNDGVQASAKMYYLTFIGFTGRDAITACDSGFHMASISEIQDPSNLQYATGGTPAYDSLASDNGLGPPTNRTGWVRTGDNVQPEIVPEVDYGVYYEADYSAYYGPDYYYSVYQSLSDPQHEAEADYSAYYGPDYYYSVYQSLSNPQHEPELRCSAFWYDARSGQPASDPTVIAHVVRQSCSQPERVWCVEGPK